MRKVLIPIVAAIVFVAAPAFAQGSGSSGDIGGANTMGAGQQTAGTVGGTGTGNAIAPKKMKMKKKSAKI